MEPLLYDATSCAVRAAPPPKLTVTETDAYGEVLPKPVTTNIFPAGTVNGVPCTTFIICCGVGMPLTVTVIGAAYCLVAGEREHEELVEVF